MPTVVGGTEVLLLKEDLITTATHSPAFQIAFAPWTFSEQFLNKRNRIFFTEILDCHIYFLNSGTLKDVLLSLLITSQLHDKSNSGCANPQTAESQEL